MVSSGSTANELIAQYAKRLNPKKPIVVFPSVTWQTSISPWINNGFTPKFIDINLKDFSIDLDLLENYLKAKNHSVNTVFLTSLIGLTPDIPRAENICKKYGVQLKLDNCENSFGSYYDEDIYDYRHVCSGPTSSTSVYFGHQTTTGSEGGMIFTNDEEEFVFYVLGRSHGLTRELNRYDLSKDYAKILSNKLVDPSFDFNTLGGNYRSTNIAAFMGLLDFKRIYDYAYDRLQLYNTYSSNLDVSKYLLPDNVNDRVNVPFCLPIISKKRKSKLIKNYLKEKNIEYRPIISGNILRHTCYKQYEDYKLFKNAEYLHKNGLYVGLHSQVSEDQILNLTDYLNQV
jgi:CDP-6-deoxy-D-xylo-4-hexulose-3-dehydrase